jgi:hypothetical protein
MIVFVHNWNLLFQAVISVLFDKRQSGCISTIKLHIVAISFYRLQSVLSGQLYACSCFMDMDSFRPRFHIAELFNVHIRCFVSFAFIVL